MTRLAVFVAATVFLFAVVWMWVAAAGTVWAAPVAVVTIAAAVAGDAWDRRRRSTERFERRQNRRAA